MTLEELTRQHTRELRDALALVETKWKDLRGQREAAEDSLKRLSTEIALRRAHEHDAKEGRNETEQKVAEVRAQLDEIERQRSELIERLLDLQRQQDEAERDLQGTKADVGKAEAEMRTARGEVERIARELERKAEERVQHQRRLRQAYTACLDEYLAQVTQRLEQVAAGEQQREQRLAAVEAFRKARHENRDVGQMCDQRDQLKELLKLASVPAVKGKLEALLADVEQELDRLHPGALSLDQGVPQSASVEELYYFLDKTDRASILLPVNPSTWEAIGAGQTDLPASTAIRAVWSIVAALALKPADGEFQLEEGRCVFASSFGAEDISALVALSVSAQEPREIQFRLAPLPSEVQEALVDEAPNL